MNQERTGSNFYALPAEVLNDKSLSHAEKIAYAIIFGLSDDQGKSWPSNQWLQEKLDVDERQVQNILSNLEKNGYIQREIIRCENNKFKTYRVIYVQSSFKLFLPDEKKCTSGPKKNAPIIDKKEVIDKKESLSLTLSPPKPPDPMENWRERMLKENWKEEEIQKAINKLKEQPEGVVSNIFKWMEAVLKSERAKKTTEQNVSKTALEALGRVTGFEEGDHRYWARIVQKKLFSDRVLDARSGDFAEFIQRDGNVLKIYYRDPKFLEILKNCLRNRDYHVEELWRQLEGTS